jgi:hypothetical protein
MRLDKLHAQSRTIRPTYGCDMAASGSPDDSYAIHHDAEYVPIDVLGDQQVSVQPQGERGALLCQASRPLGNPYPDVTHLLFVVHGALRNSNVYFSHAQRAAELSGVKDRTLIVAPQFLADVDATPVRPLPQAAVYWDVESWKGGSPSIGPVPISSFTAMDLLLRYVVHATWPGIEAGIDGVEPNRTIVIAGNSAGGQFVNRYAAVGLEPRVLTRNDLVVRFLISNPSAYVYFSADRPVTVAAGAEVNRWRYGFDDPVPYVDGTAQDYLKQYLSRDVTLVLGEEDRNPADLLLGVSPPQMAQGANRFERGVNYHHHVQEMARKMGLAASSRLITLPHIGHDAGDVLAAKPTRDVLFA